LKSSVEKIRARFEGEVERFSNLETGQTATMDAALCLGLVTEAAAAVTPGAKDLLDLGCGAGNYTLRMLQRIGELNCTLVDLSRAMLDRAQQRVGAATSGAVRTMEGDMRELGLGEGCYDIVLAAATLHHLRTPGEWQMVFRKVYDALRPGGGFWIFDHIDQASDAVREIMRRRHADHLIALKGGGAEGAAYAEKVFAYIAEEDTPATLGFQLDLLRAVGFQEVDVLHKNGPFTAFGGVKRVGSGHAATKGRKG
jgi:tRNA (cmo5U34)-methyltransferase